MTGLWLGTRCDWRSERTNWRSFTNFMVTQDASANNYITACGLARGMTVAMCMQLWRRSCLLPAPHHREGSKLSTAQEDAIGCRSSVSKRGPEKAQAYRSRSHQGERHAGEGQREDKNSLSMSDMREVVSS